MRKGQYPGNRYDRVIGFGLSATYAFSRIPPPSEPAPDVIHREPAMRDHSASSVWRFTR